MATDAPSVLETVLSATLHGRSGESCLELVVAYVNSDRSSTLSEFAEVVLGELGEVQISGEATEEQSSIIQSASAELEKHQHKFRAALMWLCSPKATNSRASLSVARLGTVEWGRYPLIDEKSEHFVRYFEIHGLKHFKNRLSLQDDRVLITPRIVHFVDLFCACVLSRCIGKEASELPIKICLRCGKFFLSKRGKYCSQECQWKHYWTPERRSDDKWVKDLEKFSHTCKPKYGRSISDLQKRLALPRVRDRLISIKEKIETKDWAGWIKIAKKIEAIEKLARKSID